MKYLNTSNKMSRVFRVSVLALVFLLVACGGDADEPTPTATTDAGQSALPTVPALESTPDTEVSEEEITILEPEIPATAEVATPDASEEQSTPDEGGDVALTDDVATPDEGLVDLTGDGEGEEVDVASTPDEEDASVVDATPPGADQQPVDEATPPVTDEPVADDASSLSEEVATPPVDAQDSQEDASPEAVETAPEDDSEQATERVLTGEETFEHPGDGTGGSGMPGENNVNEPAGEDDDVPEATPAASPIAQLTITGCEVPDVPGFLGDTTTFILTVDVNFRSGPGVDCDPLMDEPLGLGQTVEVIGGPVTQSEDDSEWVQIEIDGQPGWITTEFIEPVE